MRRLILLLFLVLGLTRLVAAQVAPVRYRNPSTAVAYAFLIPGGGHLYAGETGKGLTLATIGLGSLVGGYLLATRCQSSTEALDYGTSSSSDCGPRTGPLLAGGAVYMVAWVIGMTDAGPAAKRANTRHGLAIVPLIQPGTATRLGLRIALGSRR